MWPESSRRSQLRLAGEGAVGPHGAARGDLFVEIHVKPHSLFRRHGKDILLEVPIGFAQAARIVASSTGPSCHFLPCARRGSRICDKSFRNSNAMSASSESNALP